MAQENSCQCGGDIVDGNWVYGGVPEDTCPVHNPVCTVVGNTIYIKNGVSVGTYMPTDGKKQAWMAFMGNAELAQKMADLINEYMPVKP